jgi:pilus assembly protein CpaF
MVNNYKTVFVEKDGRLIKLKEIIFEDETHLLHVIKRIVLRIGRRVDHSSPMVDARLPDGSRVNAIIPPLALDGCVLTIRKFPKKALLMDDLVQFNALTAKMAQFLGLCVKAKLNVLVAGGTGSGKTTLLNSLSAFIHNEERVITIEDSAELRIHNYIDHVIRMETRPANAEGQGLVSARDLIKNSLRMRPNRIVVGECRSGEAIDMLQAMNTGHEGSMTTLHANTARDTLKRLETLVLMAGLDLPLKTVREMIASTINIIAIQSRFSDGSRRVKQISEIVGMEGDTITTQDIFLFKQTGIDSKGKIIGHFQPTGVLPKFVPQMRAMGFEVPMELFAPDSNPQVRK